MDLDEQTKNIEIKEFSDDEAFSEGIYACCQCFVDIFLESKILYHVEKENAFFVKQSDSINYVKAINRTAIYCANCNLKLGYAVYHSGERENELRIENVLLRYMFR